MPLYELVREGTKLNFKFYKTNPSKTDNEFWMENYSSNKLEEDNIVKNEELE